MTQFFRSPSNHHSTVPGEKRNATGGLGASSKQSGTLNRDFPRRVKNFFRISSFSSNSGSGNASGDGPPAAKSDTKPSFRQSRFLPTLGRHRSTTVASEGNVLDDTVSPTALANPYFAHQGPPALRHHNEGSVPPSPPDTPRVPAPDGDDADQKTRREELARKLRRVASAPNAQGLFANGESSGRPATAGGAKAGQAPSGNKAAQSTPDKPVGPKMPPPPAEELAPPRHPLAFRRTYSSNSIKVRNVEVGPSSFDKIKLIGKGDVGKVYLVREKKSSRLYAMKGMFCYPSLLP